MHLSPGSPLVFLGALAALLALSTAHGQTPTPTAEVAATPSPEQVATFTGAIYLDAHNAESPVAAKVGDVVCGEGVTLNVPGGPGSPGGFGYRVAVLSQESSAGCGFDGAVVTFFVGGRQASQIGIWRAGVTQIMALTAPPRSRLLAAAYPVKSLFRARPWCLL